MSNPKIPFDIILNVEKEEIIREAVKAIKISLKKKCAYKIFLFGSNAKGDFTETSDIDIGILAEKQIPFSIMVEIRERIEQIKTLRKIDAVDLNSMSENFKNSALKYARIIDYE
ncbi:MAG: nucleotidyltransferase domain-containing protein [Elusimicrobia bacterium]|nr:nucleotidyltransferase domain-containing protein [Elusimicrobiota bacterium]